MIVDAISGVTGAGKSCNARTHFAAPTRTWKVYGVGKHRHTPEIEQILGPTDRVVFTPRIWHRSSVVCSPTVTLPLTPQAIDTLTLEDVVDHYKAVLRRSNLRTRTPMPVSSPRRGFGRRHQRRPDWPRAQQARGRAGGDGRHRQSVQGRCGPSSPVRQYIVFGFDERRGLPTVACPV